jgi:hypothetical protein
VVLGDGYETRSAVVPFKEVGFRLYGLNRMNLKTFKKKYLKF